MGGHQALSRLAIVPEMLLDMQSGAHLRACAIDMAKPDFASTISLLEQYRERERERESERLRDARCLLTDIPHILTPSGCSNWVLGWPPLLGPDHADFEGFEAWAPMCYLGAGLEPTRM